MAAVVLSALLQVVFDKLVSLIKEEQGMKWGVNKEMERLKSTLSTIQAVLEDAEEQQVEDKAVRNWLGKLKDAAYDADDMLDEFMTEALPRKIESRDHMMNKVVRERLDAIASERSKLHLTVRRRRSKTSNRLQSDSFVAESEIFRREDDKEKVVESLIKTCNEDVSVIPIVGMGGLGKTTLAQLAYNDHRAERHFELRMWVCVSDYFDLRRVTKAIIESATGNTCGLLDMDLLQRRLQENVRGKKFLLVLDDMWNEDPEEWNRLKHYLSGARGSKIIVTTRSEKVALIMGTLPPHQLARLSEDDCWSLFKKRAFVPEEEDRHPNLIIIGKEVVSKCGGLPLAAKTLGSLMRFKREEAEWIFLKESEDMGNMLNLRLLEIFTNESLIDVPRRFKSFTTMPVHIRKLKCLQTLPIFIVGTSMGCRIRELKDLNLRGELFIKSLENVKDANDSKEANLKHKQNLHTLGLSWNSCDNDATVRENIEQILEGLEPHPNLKRLLLDSYTGTRFPHWMSESLLPNLNEIALVNYRRCESLPSFGQLPFLKALTICGMDAVRCIDDAFYGNNVTSIFPSLEEFTIEDMANLGEISVGCKIETFPHLVGLTVMRCPKLKNLPHLPSIKRLQLEVNNWALVGLLANFTSLIYLYIGNFAEPESLKDVGCLMNLIQSSVNVGSELHFISEYPYHYCSHNFVVDCGNSMHGPCRNLDVPSFCPIQLHEPTQQFRTTSYFLFRGAVTLGFSPLICLE
ncbi:hypothetical protein MRB53_008223 [Persea americana]|uniref:Uncharacterized protein n=1 Tax=Persea americana TaxID=3435 RepID=A0ACC2MM51_PERAE|nr:hypothetical protein MRB53_008223 [Persea americana]